MGVTAPFPYTMDPDESRSNVTGVFKLWFGKRYFIYKGLKMKATVENLSAQIHRERQNPKENSILIRVVSYIRAARVTSMDVEVIKATDDQVDLLMTEYEALTAARKDENCLNSDFVNFEHYPRWMSQVAINEFQKRLQGVKMPDKHRNLKLFIKKALEGLGREKMRDEASEAIFKYVTERFR